MKQVDHQLNEVEVRQSNRQTDRHSSLSNVKQVEHQLNEVEVRHVNSLF